MQQNRTNKRTTAKFATIAVLLFGAVGLLNLPTTASAQTEKHPTHAPNLLLNSQFKTVDYGNETTVTCWNNGQASGGCDGGTFFANRWRSKVTKPGSQVTLKPSSRHSGGVDVDLSTDEADFIYIRQSIPGIEQFIGQTLTMRVELDNPNPNNALQYDIYVNARFNRNDTTRRNIEDSDQLPLTAGTQVIYQTLDLTDPDLIDLDLTQGDHTLDSTNSLETAFRIYSPTATDRTVSIKNISVYQGTSDQDVSFSDPSYEAALLAQWYETSTYVTPAGGLGDQSGQKRAFFPFTATKRLGTDYRLSFSDASGKPGYVSGYMASGQRVDGIKPTAISKTSNGFVVVVNNTDLTGFGASWVADSEI